MKKEKEYFDGCLLGGAIGDALGAPIEFMKLEKIRELYGEQGITTFLFPKDSQVASITDDTQLTLFTAEGILRSITRSKQKKITRSTHDTCKVVFRSYLRWLYTQGLAVPHWSEKEYDGWLVKQKALHAYREPGVTCITSLGKGMMGKVSKPTNDSKHCGALARAVAIGLVEEEFCVFETGMEVGAITHGHPTAYLAAGTFATIIHYIVHGVPIKNAVVYAIDHLKQYKGHEDCLTKIHSALYLLENGKINTEYLHSLGTGVGADEVLAMAIYCALAYEQDFTKAILFAVNQDGDSDSVGAITGNLLGAAYGINSIPKEWIEKVELSKQIQEIALDLYMQYEDSEKWRDRYPGW